jgi:hypothetical protein
VSDGSGGVDQSGQSAGFWLSRVPSCVSCDILLGSPPAWPALGPLSCSTPRHYYSGAQLVLGRPGTDVARMEHLDHMLPAAGRSRDAAKCGDMSGRLGGRVPAPSGYCHFGENFLQDFPQAREKRTQNPPLPPSLPPS